MILFFAVFFEIFEEIAMRAKTVFASNWVFEEEGFEWLQGKGHVAAKENKHTYARKISEYMPHGGKINNNIEGELAKDYSQEKDSDIYRQDRLASEFLICVESYRDKECHGEERY